MKSSHIILAVVWLFVAIPCKANLQLDTQQTSKQVYDKIKTTLEAVVVPYESARSQGVIYNGKLDTSYVSTSCYELDDASHYAWKFNNKTYLSSVGWFIPKVEQARVPEEEKLRQCYQLNESKSYQNHECYNLTRYYREHKVCHLFLLNQSDLSKIASVTELHIATDRSKIDGFPRCRGGCEISNGGNKGAFAIALAKEFPDAMLVTLTYSDSAITDSPRIDKAPPEYQTTLLLRWSEENGQLKIEQDDSCLGNPNSIATIAEARKKLKQCKERSGR